MSDHIVAWFNGDVTVGDIIDLFKDSPDARNYILAVDLDIEAIVLRRPE